MPVDNRRIPQRLTHRLGINHRRVQLAVATAAAAVLVVSGPLLQGPSTADAQAGGKYRRTTPKIDPKVTQTDRTSKLANRALKTKKSDQAPTLSADEFLNVQGKVGDIRRSQQKKLQMLIRATDDEDAEKPDLLFRLAESFAQEQRYHRFRKFEALDKANSGKGAAKSKAKSAYNKHKKAEKSALTNAVKVYSVLAKNKRYRNYKKMDEVLFYYAYTLQAAKEIKLSRIIFKQLIQNYPKSKYVPNAFLSFADYFFEAEDLERAEQFYGKVLEFPKSGVYDFALYKMGWVYLNQDRNQDALTTFFKVAQNTRGKKQKVVLNKASKKDFVRAYSEVGKAQSAHTAFQRVDKGYAFTMLKILALLYFDQGRAEKSIYTFRELMKLKPKHKEVCEWQYNIQQAVLTVGSKKEIVEETTRLDKLYSVYGKKKWLKGAALSECRENAQAVTGELAKLWHIEANRTLNVETLGYAAGLYDAYVKYFPNAKDLGEMQFYYADLLWSRAEKTEDPRLATDRWEKAATEFSNVVASGKVKGKLKKEAAYAAVLGWKNALKIDPRTKAPPPPKDFDAAVEVPKPRPIDGRQKKMIGAFDIYIKYIKDKKDKELVMMKFLKARIYWRHDHLEKSLPMFQDIVENHPQHETALYSANILLDNLIRLKKFDVLVEVTNNMLADKAFIDDKDELRGRLATIKAKSMRKAAKQLEEEKKWVQCGQAYLDIFETDPGGSGMDEVLYNAGVCFEEGKSIGFAISMYRQLREKFPNSPQSQKALVRMGDAFGSIARYKDAAALYEEYAKKYGGEDLAPKALSQAVTYRKGIGDDAQAIKNTEFFVKQYRRKQRQETAEALFSMTAIYEKQGKTEKVVSHLKRYLKEYGSKGGRGRVVIANARIGELLWEQSCKVRGVDGACVKIVREKALRRRKKRRRRGGVSVPKRCGEADRIVLTVIDRDKRRVKEAQSFLRRAIKEWEKGESGIDETQRALAANWAMASKFYLAESQYESFLDLAFPEKLDFNPEKPKVVEKSKKRFAKWLVQKNKLGSATNNAYDQILKGKSAAWAIAASARMGQIPQNMADGLYRAEVPAVARTGPYAEDLYFAYCGQLEDVAKPAEQRSIAAFTFCLAETTKRNWFNRWAKLCERELGSINRQDFPPADELHGAADEAAPVTDTSPILVEIAK